MPFQPGGGNPSTNEWHHLVLTYNGTSNERAIYVDGVLSNSENDGPIFNTHPTDTNGTPLPIVIGNQNENNGTRTDNLSAEMSIAKIKVFSNLIIHKLEMIIFKIYTYRQKINKKYFHNTVKYYL